MKALVMTTVAVLIVLISPVQAQEIDGTQTLDEIKGEVGTTPRSIDIPEGSRGSIAGPSTGASRESVVPPTYNKRTEIIASVNAGLGYSCGNFDPFNNVEQMLNNLEGKLQRLPQNFVMAVQAYIASLPAYLLNKINPTLYNTITKAIDEAFALFETEYKNCAQIEREIQLGENPYGQLFKASIGRNQAIVIGEEGIAIEEAMIRVREEGAIQGVMLAGGETYGGEGQEPVDIHGNLVLAGANIMLGRGAMDESAYSLDPALNPLVRYFESPVAMVEFVRDVYGSTKYDLTPEGQTLSTPGIGYQHEYIRIRNQQIAYLRQFVKNEIDRAQYEELAQAQIAPEYLKEIRRLDLTAKDIAIDDFARELAIKKMLEKFDFVVKAITAGLREPNIAKSEAYQVVESEAAKLMLTVQQDIAHLNNARYQ